MEEKIEDISKIVAQMDLEDLSVTPCPSVFVKRNTSYLLGNYSGDESKCLCDITGEECVYRGHVFKEEMFTKGYFCLQYVLPLPLIELYLEDEPEVAAHVPTVQELIARKRNIDYSEYIIMRGKIRRD